MEKKRNARLLCLLIIILVLIVGCASSSKQKTDPPSRGIVYFLDGAGGNGLITNWSPGVKQGLSQAGFHGDFKSFPWETGLGALADQAETVEYKRQKASALAKQIREYSEKYPTEPIHLIGLSAGTAVTIFALESLPDNCSVDTVVLLGSSVNANYNLTRALKHVKKGFYVFTSERDEVLRNLVPLTGTADRQYVGDHIAGLQGFYPPSGAPDETRHLYGKVTNIHWVPEFAQADNWGGHTDGTNSPFVKKYVAPLLSVETASVEKDRPFASESTADAIQ